jgi:hypothetical protein
MYRVKTTTTLLVDLPLSNGNFDCAPTHRWHLLQLHCWLGRSASPYSNRYPFAKQKCPTGSVLGRLILSEAPRIAEQQPSITVAGPSHAFDMPMYRSASRSRLSHSFLAVASVKSDPLAFEIGSSMSLSPDSGMS